MFDAKISSSDIKKRYSWQAVKKLSAKDIGKHNYMIRKDYIREYGVTYQSAMTGDLGNGLQIKTQDEIIGKDGSFRKPGNRKTSNNIAHPPSEDEQFVDARINEISGKEEKSVSKGKEKVVESETEKIE
uniref:Uncharacterized protein n=1 Tax=Rhizophagus irregularis (strain DAOM 181602 / DAOM 197198 / MUCL 43194) TaxID=747089 RepID=U9TR21_RHIID